MIQPEDIARKAEAIYRDYLRSWIAGGAEFFPRLVPAQREPDADAAQAIAQVRRLREASKEVVGYGYAVEWREVNSRRHGRNPFPQRIVIETELDLLRLVRKEREFGRLASAVGRLRAGLPELEAWIRSNLNLLSTPELELDGLVDVVLYLKEHPRPGCFARELPVAVDTKFLERNAGVLRQWLDIVLSPSAIRADEEHFERRFGLKYVEPLLSVRVLDAGLRSELGFPCELIGLPLHSAGALRFTDTRVIVVENLVNLYALPPLSRTIGIGGLGNGAALLRYLPWLADARLTYWGDIDIEGLEILSRVRALFPQTDSVLMDRATCERHRYLMAEGSGRGGSSPVPACLTAPEREAFSLCAAQNLRLEQERIPQAAVATAFASDVSPLG